MAKFFKNLFNFEFDSRNAGRTNIKTAIKKIDETISSNPIFNFSKNSLLFERIV